MLAQTNLQLYRQLLDAQWPDADLATTRAAYELARQLFVHCHRPSQKPFLCHLVGAASALVAWEKQQPLVWAGRILQPHHAAAEGLGAVPAADEAGRL
ncbi:MAG: hypothetical protein AAGF31_04650, partial [Planctomycetota bacterium]